jgi:hypothetical protein
MGIDEAAVAILFNTLMGRLQDQLGSLRRMERRE